MKTEKDEYRRFGFAVNDSKFGLTFCVRNSIKFYLMLELFYFCLPLQI